MILRRARKIAPQQPAPVQPLTIRWTPEASPQGEVMPLSVLADLAARPRDVWSGTRDTDRR